MHWNFTPKMRCAPQSVTIEPPGVNLYNYLMNLPIEQVQHIANLARLELSPEEIARYRDQLSAILDYFQQLEAIDTQAVPPTTSGVKLETTLRDDRVLPSLLPEDVLGNAAEIEQGQFRVPPVFE